MRFNFRGLGSTELVPPSAGVSDATAQSACVAANGTWVPPTGLSPSGNCSLDIGASLPSYCSWVPFATSLFSECTLPTTSAQLAAYGNYTAYMVGMQSGIPAEQAAIAQNTTQSASLLSDPTGTGNAEANCEYNAAANNPAMAQMIGPTLTCALTDPLNSSYSLLVYGGLALLGFLLFQGLKR